VLICVPKRKAAIVGANTFFGKTHSDSPLEQSQKVWNKF